MRYDKYLSHQGDAEGIVVAVVGAVLREVGAGQLGARVPEVDVVYPAPGHTSRAGHQLPTGDPERWVQVDVVFLDAEGQVVGEPWQVRLGQVWEWWPAPNKLGDYPPGVETHRLGGAASGVTGGLLESARAAVTARHPAPS